MTRPLFFVLVIFMFVPVLGWAENQKESNFCDQMFEGKGLKRCYEFYFPCERLKNKEKKYLKCQSQMKQDPCKRHVKKPKKYQKCKAKIEKYAMKAHKFFIRHHKKYIKEPYKAQAAAFIKNKASSFALSKSNQDQLPLNQALIHQQNFQQLHQMMLHHLNHHNHMMIHQHHMNIHMNHINMHH